MVFLILLRFLGEYCTVRVIGGIGFDTEAFVGVGMDKDGGSAYNVLEGLERMLLSVSPLPLLILFC